MAMIKPNPSKTEKMFESKTNAAYPNDENFAGMKKAESRTPSGMLESDRNIDPGNEGGYRKK